MRDDLTRGYEKDDPETRLMANLLDALPLIARLTGSLVVLKNQSGMAIRSVDEKGEEATVQSELMAELARRATVEGAVSTLSGNGDGADSMWAVPFGSYVLVVSGLDRIAREAELMSSLELALPLIAKVAGGLAAIFNREGRFINAFLPNGRQDVDSIGKVWEPCRVAMVAGRPQIGPSRLVPGVLAVRIPLTENFGFGFNNCETVLKGHELLGEMSKLRTARYTWDDIVGNSECLRAAVKVAQKASATQSPVMIWGESGTGKELFAQAIHNASRRKYGPFVAVNCAALPPSLIESIIFGYREGAFTGARKGGQTGLFEQAEGGTLLLDEISELDLNLQAKLLRVLQEREVVRIGASKSTPVDVRIICTSNRDLRILLASGDFREDLFYRLNVVDVKIPALRDRKDDIPALTNFFMGRLSYELNRLVANVEPAVMARMHEYDWPGNIRELQNCIERAMNMTEGDTILLRHLPPSVANCKTISSDFQSLAARLRDAESTIIKETIRDCSGNKSEAARRLGISYMTLWRKLRCSNGTTYM